MPVLYFTLSVKYVNLKTEYILILKKLKNSPFFVLNLAIAKCHDLSVARRSIICLCLRHRQIIDLLATDKSRYFVQPRPMIV